MNKKQIVLYSILTGLALLLVVCALFVPVVQIIGHADDAAKTIVYSKTVSLFAYIKDAPFWTTQASEVYFSATGPIWLATGSILLSILIGIAGIAMLGACVFELAGIKLKNSAVKNNVLAKKLAYFAGWLAVCVGIFSIVSYTVTTLMSNGYATFLFAIGSVLFIVLGVAIICLARKTTGRAQEQQSNKLKNALGFGLTALFALLTLAIIFLPMFTEEYAGGYCSIWSITTLAESFAADPIWQAQMADLPFGVARYLCFALMAVVAFVFVYALIGFIFTLKDKKTDWLSSRIKRWSMTLLVVHTVLFAFVLCQSAVMYSSVYIPEYQLYLTGSTLMMLAGYLPYVTSALVSVEKKQAEEPIDEQKIEETPAEQPKQEENKPSKKRAKKQEKENENGWLEPNQIPNDVTAPLEKDVTKNLVDEPRPTQTDNE